MESPNIPAYLLPAYRTRPPIEPSAIQVATAILAFENALPAQARMASRFPERVAAMRAALTAAMREGVA